MHRYLLILLKWFVHDFNLKAKFSSEYLYRRLLNVGVWIHRSQNLNKTLLLLVTARLLARLNNTNGWSLITFLGTTSAFTQSQRLRMLAGWQLPWSPLGCWCHVRATLSWSLGQMLDKCHVLLPGAGLSMEVPFRSHLSQCELGVRGWWAMSWSLCWAFMTQGFYECWILLGQNPPPCSQVQLSQIRGV